MVKTTLVMMGGVQSGMAEVPCYQWVGITSHGMRMMDTDLVSNV